MNGLHAITSPVPVNLGTHNGLMIQRLLNAKYWVGTHDEVSPVGGIVRFILKRQPLTLNEALEREHREKLGQKKENG